MPRLLKEMFEDYFNEREQSTNIRLNARLPAVVSLPIKPVATSAWEVVTNPRRLHKTFEFNTHDDYTNFIIELLQYEKSSDHFGKIMCEYPSIVIEVYTHDVDDVTELDKVYATTADQIEEDILSYSNEEEIYEF
jgi:pterin-4a-carbinolamine dehydratase